MRVQLIVPENTAIHPEIFDRIMSAFGVTAVVLFAIPLALGLIGYIVPLQIGARGVAFPRLNLLSFWLYLAGAVTVYGSFLYRPSEAGLAALPPLSDDVFSNTRGVDAWIVGTGARAARLRLLRGQPRRHAAQHARARHGLAAGAAVLLGGGHQRLPAARDRPGDARGADDAVHRPPLRRRLLRLRRGRRAAALRAPRLVLLHRRLHARPDRRRRGDLGVLPDLRPQAAVQPPRRRCSRCSRSPCSARSPGCRTCTRRRSRSASRSSRCCSRSR